MQIRVIYADKYLLLADLRRLRELGAVAMLRSLVNSKHKMIAMGSTAALKNLLVPRSAASHDSKQHLANHTAARYHLIQLVVLMYFLPRDTMLARYMLWPCVRMSVCVCVCLSQVGVVLKRLNVE